MYNNLQAIFIVFVISLPMVSTHDSQVIDMALDYKNQGDLLSHSGRTNKDGCHNDRKRGTYHCH